MLSERFTDSLNGLVFPRKLFLLASSDEVKSINWARDGTTVEIHSILLCEECFHPKVFNVKSNQHVLRQLSYYKFEKLDQKKKLWEFKHPFFHAGREDLVPLIKRTPQRVPKKFVNDVERRCSPRIRSMASRKRPQIYDAETDDDELGPKIDFKERKPLLKKLKYEEDEYFPNCRYSYSSNATSDAQTSFNKNSVLSNSNVAGRSKDKLKIDESNGCPPIKKKRGRPRKQPLPTGTISKGPSSTKTEEKYEDVGMPSTSREYFVKTSISPSPKLYHDCLNSDWRHEKLNFKDKNPIWGEPNVYLPNCITENASLVGYPKKKTVRKLPDKNGMIEYSVSDDLFYHDMDMARKISQIDMPYRSAKVQEETNKNNLPSTSAEKERPPILIKVSRNEFRGNESGEIRYGMHRENCHNENRSGEKLRSSSSTNVDGTQKQNYKGDGAKMNPTYENGTFGFPVDDVRSSQKVECTNENFSIFNYMPQNYLESNSNWEMEQRSTEKPTTSLVTSLSDKTAISPQQLSDFQGNKFFNKLDQVDFASNTGDKVYNYTPQPSYSRTEDFFKYPLASYGCFNANANGLLTEFKNDCRIQENFIYSLTNLDDNREGGKNNLKDSSKIDQNRKISESCVVIPVSNECQQQTPSSTPEHQFDSHSTTNSDHNYCLEKETDYTLVDSIMKPEFSEAILQSLLVSKSGNQDAVSHQLNFLGAKYPAEENELVNPKNQFNETKYMPNGVVEMEQDSIVQSSENFQSRQDSSVPTFESKTESDIFDAVSNEIIDLIEKFDYNCSRSEENSDDVEILKQMASLQNHSEAFLRTETTSNAGADEHRSNFLMHSDYPYFESSSNNSISREGKPLRLIEFLGEQLQDGRIYSWDFMHADLVIKDCAADFIDWCTRKSAPRLNGLN